MTDDLRARLVAALEDCRTLIPEAMADVVMGVVQPEIDLCRPCCSGGIVDGAERVRRWLDAYVDDLDRRRAYADDSDVLDVAIGADGKSRYLRASTLRALCKAIDAWELAAEGVVLR